MGPGHSLRPKKGFQCSAESSSPVGCSIFVSNAEEEAVYKQGQEQGHQLGSRKNSVKEQAGGGGKHSYSVFWILQYLGDGSGWSGGAEG